MDFGIVNISNFSLAQKENKVCCPKNYQNRIDLLLSASASYYFKQLSVLLKEKLLLIRFYNCDYFSC